MLSMLSGRLAESTVEPQLPSMCSMKASAHALLSSTLPSAQSQSPWGMDPTVCPQCLHAAMFQPGNSQYQYPCECRLPTLHTRCPVMCQHGAMAAPQLQG
jgi:hypothetical protein